MRVAIVGARGQLGTALQTCLQAEVLPLDHAEIEITDAASVDRALSSVSPDCVVNAAAYNFVDRAEDEPSVAYEVNAVGPRHLAHWCDKAGATFVHVSSDYVFGFDTARHSPYTEVDIPGPTSAYAVSKLAGEYFVQSALRKHFIVRTCGLYGAAASEGKGNFVKTILRLATQRKELTIVNDQRCTPSYAVDVAQAIAGLISTKAFGLYHVTNAGSASWYEFASEIVRLAKLGVHVRPITSAEYPQKARRPAYSVLDCSKLFATTGSRLPSWEDGLARYLRQITGC